MKTAAAPAAPAPDTATASGDSAAARTELRRSKGGAVAGGGVASVAELAAVKEQV